MNPPQTPHPDQTLVDTATECIRQLTGRKLVTGLIQIANATQQSLRALRQARRQACLDEWKAQNPDRAVMSLVMQVDDQDLDAVPLGQACRLEDPTCESCQ